MATEIRVPTLGESVTEATVGTWFKKVGDAVDVDEPLVELETDKITLEVPAPTAGVVESISVGDGETVEVGALLGSIAAGKGQRPVRRRQRRHRPSGREVRSPGADPVRPRGNAACAGARRAEGRGAARAPRRRPPRSSPRRGSSPRRSRAPARAAGSPRATRLPRPKARPRGRRRSPLRCARRRLRPTRRGKSGCG